MYYNFLRVSNYAILGYLLGHELSHAFDAGMIHNYIPEISFENSFHNYYALTFHEKIRCFVDQFKNSDLKEVSPELAF